MKINCFLGATALVGIFAAFPVAAFAQTDQSTAPSDAQTTGQQAPVVTGTTPPAEAQAANANDENDIIVTGSRLKRTAATIDQPAEVLGAQQIEARGYTDVGRALQELPAFSVPANSLFGAQGSFSAGQTFANLYNLGAQRTLSLVNGQRFVSSATSSIFGPVAGSPVDLNAIPTSLVERIETISVGGAPIYGSDAIAGTVNIILKKNYEGLHLDGQTGVSQKGDAQEYELSLLAGHNFDNGRGNITLAAQYDRQMGLPTSARYYRGGNSPFFGSPADPNSPYVNVLYYGGMHYTEFTNTGIPLFADYYPNLYGSPITQITNAAGQALYFSNEGHLVPFDFGQETGGGIYNAGGSGFAIGDYDNLITDSHRVQIVALGHYDITDHIRFSAEGWYGHLSATNLRAQPFYNTFLFAAAGETNGDLIMSTDNPYLSAADRATIIANLAANGMPTDEFYLARANTDLATGKFRTTSNLYRFVGDLSGDFSVGDRNFNWDISGNYGRVRSVTTTREVVTQNFYNALNAVRDGSGNIVCAPGYTNAAIPTFNSTCAPLDVFGVGQASQAALDYISAKAQPIQTNQQFDLIASVNGSIVTLPGGDAKFSIGYEHRYESVNFDPGAFYYGQLEANGSRTQYGNTIPIDPVKGNYHTNEAFGEIDVPVISPNNHVPLIRRLDLQGAGRYVKNSITGGFWTYTGGGSYAPIRDISFRGNYTRSFRGPAITEAYAPVGQVFETADDPCDPRFLSGGPDPSRRKANCAAAGVPLTMIDPTTGKEVPWKSNIVDYTAKGTAGGNPNLKNEIADSWTAGAVLTPRFIPGLTITADYISINIKNEIASLGVEDLLDACYDAVNYPNSPFCQDFTRDANHQVVSFADGNYNIAIEKFRALQASLDYQLPLTRLGLSEKAGLLDLSVNYLHTFKHFSRIGEGDKQYSVGTTGEPADNFTANLNYDNGGFNFMWQTQFYGPTKQTVNEPQSTYEYPTFNKFFMFNSSVGYTIDKSYSIRLVVDNILNKHVPFPYDVSLTRYYNAVIGRYFHVNVGITF